MAKRLKRKRTQSDRNRISKLRSCLYDGKPLSIVPAALATIEAALQLGSFDAVRSALSFGRDAENEQTSIVNGVAVIPVIGVLRDEADWMVRWGMASSYQVIEREFTKAIANDAVKAVLFYFDSPGGSAIGCKRLADVVNAEDAKPVHSYVQGICGSAAYYIAAATDQIDATADSYVGSIGTIFPHTEYSRAFDEMGITPTVITSANAPKKGHGNIYEPLSDAAKQTLQEYVDSYGNSFVEDVARYRGVSASTVASDYGQGDGMRADLAIKAGVIDSVVANFAASLSSISGVESSTASSVEEEDDDNESPVLTGTSTRKGEDMKFGKKIRAQLLAFGLIADMDASDDVCAAAIAGRIGVTVEAVMSGQTTEAVLLSNLQASVRADESNADDEDDEDDDEESSDDSSNTSNSSQRRQRQPAQQHEEHAQARIADYRAAATLVNDAAGYDVVTPSMVMDAFADESIANVSQAMSSWNETIAASEPHVPTQRVTVHGERGAEQYQQDIVDAILYRCSDNPSSMEISEGALALTNRPLWAVAAECLQLRGQAVDIYGDRELLAEEAMAVAGNSQHARFYSSNESQQYVPQNYRAAQNAGPGLRPGDFPNILSGLANKFLDTIQLDDDYSYPAVSAVMPGGLNDFKPAMLINKGIVEELQELSDAEQLKQVNFAEEVLSYLFLRRFGGKFGWTPVMIANDDLGAFVEGMLGLAEAWQVTQNRLVVERYTSSDALLDGSALFANRTDVKGAANDNLKTSGGTPSDAQWAAMEVKHADIGGINTGRRVRGSLNVAFVPTGTAKHDAMRTFAPINQLQGGEQAAKATDATIGIFRGNVSVVPESELRANSTTSWYGLRNPTRLNTATVVRAYFNSFGTAGRRERWYDPTDKTTWVSLEGRIAVATKNWRNAVKNVT